MFFFVLSLLRHEKRRGETLEDGSATVVLVEDTRGRVFGGFGSVSKGSRTATVSQSSGAARCSTVPKWLRDGLFNSPFFRKDFLNLARNRRVECQLVLLNSW